MLRSEQLLPNFLGKQLEVELRKMIGKRTVRDGHRSAKTGSGRPKTARTADAMHAVTHAADTNGTSVDRTLLNKSTKFGAEIFRRYRLPSNHNNWVLGNFLSRTRYIGLQLFNLEELC